MGQHLNRAVDQIQRSQLSTDSCHAKACQGDILLKLILILSKLALLLVSGSPDRLLEAPSH